ncbi:peptidylprolyl isomerase [Hyphobacterium sp. HN65]|uniref:Parvulin-like PPIase n=1 Tax=Hyphobacterium lacteum TaxID=3116575 RepID=A0ABU7LLK9_9PROT|nr:peptidylprolyl isomerase [Hyphobacterium sp. HN65]MEE2524777.1 peptidylprolyl isomerase [Hyphobacterium sp. HN65]
MKRSLTAFLALLMTAFWGSHAHAQQVEGIAALVNDYPITTVDVRNRMRLIIVSSGIQPTEEALVRIQQEALRSLIDETLQIQEALEYEIQVDPAEIDAAIANIAVQNNADPDQIAAELAASGVDIITLRRQLEAEIAWQIIVGGRYNNRIRISNQQIEATLERVAASASQPQYRLAEIFIEIPVSSSEAEAQQRTVAVMTQLTQGAPFQAVAQQFSDAPSAANGGEVGWLLEGQMRPEVAQVARALEPGQLSRPFRVPGGLMIIALIDQRESSASIQYDLVQATLPASRVNDASVAAFDRAISRINSCDGIDSGISAVEGAFSSRLGQISLNALLPEIAERLSSLGPGENTGAIETPAGRQVYFVCDRSIGGPGVPTREDIERQLRNQQLSMLSRRWLRDLRRDSTIEIR